MSGIKGANAGKKNGMWKGNDIKVASGRCRAIRMYPKKPCEVCGSEKSERHHVDGNTRNNNITNIKFLCRKHHMIADGRLDALARYTPKYGQHNNGGWKKCGNCGKKYRGNHICVVQFPEFGDYRDYTSPLQEWQYMNDGGDRSARDYQ